MRQLVQTQDWLRPKLFVYLFNTKAAQVGELEAALCLYLMLSKWWWCAFAAYNIGNQRHYKQNNKGKEQQFCSACQCPCNATKTKDCCNYCKNEKCKCPTKHGLSPMFDKFHVRDRLIKTQ